MIHWFGCTDLRTVTNAYWNETVLICVDGLDLAELKSQDLLEKLHFIAPNF